MMGTARLRASVALLTLVAGCVRAGFDEQGSNVKSTDSQAPDVRVDGPPASGEQVFGGTSWGDVGLSSTEVVGGTVQLQQKPGFASKSAVLPGGRGWGTAAAGKDRIYIFGGGTTTAKASGTDEVLAYLPATDTIQPVAKLAHPLFGATAVVTGTGKIAVVMGIDPTISAEWEAQAQIFDPVSSTWTKPCSGLYAAYYHASALGADGLIYSFAGFGSGPLYKTIEALNPESGQVVPVAATLPSERDKLRAFAAPNGSIYIFGGALVHDDEANLGGNITTQIFKFTPPGTLVLLEARLPWPLMNIAGGLLPDGQIVLAGGDVPRASGTGTEPTIGLLRFDPKTETIATLSEVMPEPLSGAASAVGGNGKLYLFGGLTHAGLSAKVLELHPYTTSGEALGPVVDTGNAPWRELDWQANLPAGTTVEMAVRAADVAFAPTAAQPSWQVVASHPASTLPAGRHLQWRATLRTTTTALSPGLEQVKIRYGSR